MRRIALIIVLLAATIGFAGKPSQEERDARMQEVKQLADDLYRQFQEDPRVIVEFSRKMEAEPFSDEWTAMFDAITRGLLSTNEIYVPLLSTPNDNATIRVPDCVHLLGPVATGIPNEILRMQMAISSTAFVLEHPEKADDTVAILSAGLRGAIAIYRPYFEKMQLPPDPVVEYIIQRNDLETYVRETLPQCTRN